MYGADDPWLWRGQANGAYALEPAIHTRIRAHAPVFDDTQVANYTAILLRAAREAKLNEHEGVNLPDMALLALLQHHGAATPLLDVSLDPLVGLYMATVSPNLADDETDGALFAIRRPNRQLADFDSRAFREVYDSIGNEVVMYAAPDVSERLSIQRGHFLLGPISTKDSRISIPLSLDPGTAADNWLHRRMRARGSQRRPSTATSDVAVFRVTAKFKQDIRSWLEERSGLTKDFVYPTSWHQPHLDRFAAAHGRRATF